MTSLDDPEGSGRVPTIARELATDGKLEPTVAFRILADEPRRFVLYVLVERGESVAVEDLVALVGGQHDEQVSDRGLPSLVHRRLYNNHLPWLAEHGIVEYDGDADVITLTDRGEKLRPYVEFARAREPTNVEAMLGRGRRTDG